MVRPSLLIIRLPIAVVIRDDLPEVVVRSIVARVVEAVGLVPRIVVVDDRVIVPLKSSEAVIVVGESASRDARSSDLSVPSAPVVVRPPRVCRREIVPVESSELVDRPPLAGVSIDV